MSATGDDRAGDDRIAVAMRGALVRIDGLAVLGPLDLTVGRGDRWVVLGPNGSGKTTLLSLAGARRQPSSGRVTVLGTRLGAGDVRTLHPRISHTSHVLGELMPPGMTAVGVVLTGKRSTLVPWFQRFDADDDRRARQLLDQVGCGHLADRPFSTGSQGERQRALLARALFGVPELLILDEPASGLDLPAREGLLDAIGSLERDAVGPTTIIATHHLEEIPPSATHAALLRDGRLVAAGPIEETLTTGVLESTFGIRVELGRRGGRWWAFAAPDGAIDR